MKCEEVAEEIWSSSLQELPPKIYEHLKICEVCQKEYSVVQSLELRFVNGYRSEKKTGKWTSAIVSFCAILIVLLPAKFISRYLQTDLQSNPQRMVAIRELQDHLRNDGNMQEFLFEQNMDFNPSWSDESMMISADFWNLESLNTLAFINLDSVLYPQANTILDESYYEKVLMVMEEENPVFNYGTFGS